MLKYGDIVLTKTEYRNIVVWKYIGSRAISEKNFRGLRTHVMSEVLDPYYGLSPRGWTALYSFCVDGWNNVTGMDVKRKDEFIYQMTDLKFNLWEFDLGDE
jgi:hypothetical protein